MACICLAGAAARAEAALSLPRTLIYVDPVDYERALILETCELQGLKTVQLWSAPYAEMIRNRMVLNDEQIEHLASHTAPPENFETEWAQQNLEEFPVLGVLCGSDAGLATAERLQHVLTPSRSNGILSARRDKLQMNEALAAAGLSTAAQASISSWEEAEAFLTALPAPLHAVVKPRRGQSRQFPPQLYVTCGFLQWSDWSHFAASAPSYASHVCACSLRVGLATSLSQARHMVNALLETPTSLDSSEAPRPSASAVLVAMIKSFLVTAHCSVPACASLWQFVCRAIRARSASLLVSRPSLSDLRSGAPRVGASARILERGRMGRRYRLSCRRAQGCGALEVPARMSRTHTRTRRSLRACLAGRMAHHGTMQPMSRCAARAPMRTMGRPKVCLWVRRYNKGPANGAPFTRLPRFLLHQLSGASFFAAQPRTRPDRVRLQCPGGTAVAVRLPPCPPWSSFLDGPSRAISGA
eukprot:6179526-Pleurochrysis_carterae.AAC.1